ncbi:bifunctional DNA ligase [Babesia duncani]|uniref:DNA ligase n=1 Tax=Babesia duncani TaxID=323732 RepID=A0AAD9PJR3_9APIC|nr:bifunctional DNA ligase [Babesia duncani]
MNDITAAGREPYEATPSTRVKSTNAQGKGKNAVEDTATPSPPSKRNSLFGDLDDSPAPVVSKKQKSPSKKHVISPLRNQSGDEPVHGSLFNCSVNEPSDDLTSPKFDPSLFDIGAYRSSHPKCKDSLLFSLLVEVLGRAEEAFCSGIGSRRFLSVLLSNFFRVLLYHMPSDLIPSIYILQNRIAPEYEDHDIGVGESLLLKALSEAYSKLETDIKSSTFLSNSLTAVLKQHEDLGIVASLNSCTNQTLVKMPDLTIASVLEQIRSLATPVGKNAKNKKKDIIKRMLTCADRNAAKYIVRTLQEKLRVGVNSHTIFICLADAAYLTKSAKGDEPAIGDIRTSDITCDYTIDDMEKAVKTAICFCPSIEKVVGHLLEGADAATLLEHCKITPGIPVRPMLAKAVNKTSEIIAAIGGDGVEFTCEYKYDGERVQVHYLSDQSVRLFSRNMENLCQKYPDVIENFKKCVHSNVKNLIIDCEVVGYDKSSGKILTFQQLSTRKRKYVDVENIEIPVRIYPFDILYLNDESLTSLSLKERRKHLKSVLDVKDNILQWAESRDMKTLDDVDDFLRSAVSDSCEGLMIKTMGQLSTYEPQKRSVNWIKFKKDYIEGLADSVDLVPIGAFFGKGKRTSVYGSYLLAIYDPIQQVYQSVCKTGTGFSDEVLKSLHAELHRFIITNKDPNYQLSDKMIPDVWFKPVKVWECRAADLSLSPVHTGATNLLDNAKGIGLRFPRYVRSRDDKDPIDATTSQQILEMYQAQFDKGNV